MTYECHSNVISDLLFMSKLTKQKIFFHMVPMKQMWVMSILIHIACADALYVNSKDNFKRFGGKSEGFMVQFERWTAH